jgi:hypothetical protein
MLYVSSAVDTSSCLRHLSCESLNRREPANERLLNEFRSVFQVMWEDAAILRLLRVMNLTLWCVWTLFGEDSTRLGWSFGDKIPRLRTKYF